MVGGKKPLWAVLLVGFDVLRERALVLRGEGETMIRLFASAAIAALTLPLTAVAQTTPGQINDPSTYQGSMANQAQEQASAAAQEAANQQMLQRLDQNYAAYAPQGGGGAVGGSGVPPAKQLPLLPASKNPLIGKWQMGATKPVDLNGMLVFPGTESIVNGAFGGGCESVFGKGRIAFTPSQLNWVAPDGHEEILNRVEYRGDSGNVLVTPLDSDLPLVFGLTDHDHAVVAFLGCTMSRVTLAKTPVASAGAGGSTAQPGASAPAVSAPAIAANGPPPSGPPNATLSFNTGFSSPGQLTPFTSTQVFLVTENPDASLAKAGFSGANPVEAWMRACAQNQPTCTAGMKAMTASSVGLLTMDATGRAQTPSLPSGQYFLLGFAPYNGKPLVWDRPYFLRPGPNSVVLDQTNAIATSNL
jgi:hypothetical protein